MTASSGTTDAVRIIAILLALFVGLPLLMMTFALPFGMMGMWGVGMGGGFSSVGGVRLAFLVLGALLPLAGLAGVGYLLYRVLVSGDDTGFGTDPALEELRLAYARGDLDDEEFEERRKRLTERSE